MSAAQRILVTGGGKGVGAAIVRAAVAAGFDVDFTYRSSGNAAEALAAELSQAVAPCGLWRSICPTRRGRCLLRDGGGRGLSRFHP